MLDSFGITHKVLEVMFMIYLGLLKFCFQILAFNADNASNNNKQTTKLARFDNSFKSCNRVCCFNHTLQLAAKTLLMPFHSALGSKTATTMFNNGDIDSNDASDGDDEVPAFKESEEDKDSDEGDDEVDDHNKDDPDDGIYELEELGVESKVKFALDTKAI